MGRDKALSVEDNTIMFFINIKERSGSKKPVEKLFILRNASTFRRPKSILSLLRQVKTVQRFVKSATILNGFD